MRETAAPRLVLQDSAVLKLLVGAGQLGGVVSTLLVGDVVSALLEPDSAVPERPGLLPR